jgi:peptidoglycan hydrolase-like protein with peptidoglycan-binding domain
VWLCSHRGLDECASIAPRNGSTTRMEPLVITTPEAMAMPAELVEGPPDPGRSGAGCPLCKIGAGYPSGQARQRVALISTKGLQVGTVSMLNHLSRRSTVALLVLFVFTAAGVLDTVEAQSNPRILELEEGLAELGYDPGPVDGAFEPKTREAITAFQRDHHLITDGKYSGLLVFSVSVERDLAQQEATPEGRARKAERAHLLALSDSDLATILQEADQDEAEEILNIIGERVNELPFHLVLTKLGVYDESAFIVPVMLQGLYYPDSEEGIKQFQQDIGELESGKLTFGQVGEMKRRWTRFHDNEVHALGPDEILIYASDGWASVKGTWMLEGEEIAYPINQSEITCRRDLATCLSIQANVIVPGVDKDNQDYYLSVNSETYDIISWTTGEIVARLADQCRIVLLTLNMHSNEVFEITSNGETEACREAYLSPPSLDKPRIARLGPSGQLLARKTGDHW